MNKRLYSIAMAVSLLAGLALAPPSAVMMVLNPIWWSVCLGALAFLVFLFFGYRGEPWKERLRQVWRFMKMFWVMIIVVSFSISILQNFGVFVEWIKWSIVLFLIIAVLIVIAGSGRRDRKEGGT